MQQDIRTLKHISSVVMIALRPRAALKFCLKTCVAMKFVDDDDDDDKYGEVWSVCQSCSTS